MASPSSGPPPSAAPTREWLSDLCFTFERPGSFDEAAPVLDRFRRVPMDFEPR
jgi:hypothetical protein